MCNGWGRCVLAQQKRLDEAVVRVKTICSGGARPPGNVPATLPPDDMGPKPVSLLTRR